LNWAFEGRFWRHLGLAALASFPFLAWVGLGALSGSGGSFYFSLMSEMAWEFPPRFLVLCFKEPFRGWYSPSGPRAALGVLVVGVPLLAGVWFALREFRREAIAMLGFVVLSTVTIVLFGVNKPRYVHPTQWIPLFFFVLGGFRLLQRLSRPLGQGLPFRTRPVLVTAAALLWGSSFALGFRALGRQSAVVPLAGDLAFLALCLVLVVVGVGRVARRPPGMGIAAACLFLALLTPLVAGGIGAKQDVLFKIHYANYSSRLLATWLEENLGAGDRIVLLPRSHMLHLTNLDPRQLAVFANLEAENLDELVSEMRANGLTHAAYTYRRPAKTADESYYYRTKKTHLAEFFRSGGEVQGFEKVATLELPDVLERSAVQVYRLLP
jgi:hypothetical protein